MANKTDTKAEQLELTERLQLKLLKHLDQAFDEGTITSTDVATLSRLLMQNGWSIDPSRLPQGVRDKLTEIISTADFSDEDEDVAGSIQCAG